MCLFARLIVVASPHWQLHQQLSFVWCNLMKDILIPIKQTSFKVILVISWTGEPVDAWLLFSDFSAM
jgi:hypothetical protein